MNIKKDYTIYCDMDGVLADFSREKRAIERYKTEKGFFKNLKPIRENVRALKRMIKKGFQIKILSTSPNVFADIDKKEWLKKYLPMISEKDMIFSRPTMEKVEYIPTEQVSKSILIDDYRKNIVEWLKQGGKAFKVDKKHDKKLPKYLQVKNIKELLKGLV